MQKNSAAETNERTMTTKPFLNILQVFLILLLYFYSDVNPRLPRVRLQSGMKTLMTSHSGLNSPNCRTQSAWPLLNTDRHFL